MTSNLRADRAAASSGERGEAAQPALERLRECGRDELVEQLRAATTLDVPSARAALRNPHCDGECITLLSEFRQLHASYEFRRDVAMHRASPPVLASRFVPTLFWRDLARIGAAVSLRPALRRAADQLLLQRLPRLTLGEKIALSRIAGVGLLPELGRSKHPRVMAALLENPRLTEGIVLRIASSSASAPEVLALLAGNGRWGSRYAVRLALCRNAQTPLARAIGLVASLRKSDQRLLHADRSVREPVRRRARLLCEGRV